MMLPPTVAGELHTASCCSCCCCPLGHRNYHPAAAPPPHVVVCPACVVSVATAATAARLLLLPFYVQACAGRQRKQALPPAVKKILWDNCNSGTSGLGYPAPVPGGLCGCRTARLGKVEGEGAAGRVTWAVLLAAFIDGATRGRPLQDD